MSMAASIIVFLSAVQIRRAVELSVFPTLLLLLTLFRLALNIASSRRILLHGQEGTAAAGKVIEAFGQFVVGGNYVVGFVLFLALIAIQFLVVSHGAVRTAEVTARFTLDALPGKQMAIDADMNAGLIDEVEARRRRQAIAREAEFYGAMDGAARFNQRDSLATILITGINIIAGLLIGTLQQGIELGEAARTYTVLTVGDGLVTIIPSLLVSVAGGITLTRANSAGHAGRRDSPAAAGQAGHAVPGQPGLRRDVPDSGPAEARLSAGFGRAVYRRADASRHAWRRSAGRAGGGGEEEGERGAGLGSGQSAAAGRADAGDRLPVDSAGGRETGRPTAEPGALAAPPSFGGDGLSGAAGAYLGQSAPAGRASICFSLRGMEIGRWQTEGAQLLAVSGEPNRRPLAGKETREPAFGVPAIWIAPALEDQAIAAGYSVVDAVTVITTHLGELIRQHALGAAGPGRDQAADGLAQREPSQTAGRTGAQAALAGRGGPGAGATAAGAGLDPRSGRDSGGACWRPRR